MRALYVMGIVVIAASLQVTLGAIEAPEIDPSSAVSALGLLTGGIMVLRAKFGR